MGNHNRRHYVVDMDFQSRFILRFVFAMVVGMGASIVLFNYLAMNALESLKWRMVIFESSLAEIIMPYMFYITVFAAVFTALLLGVVSRSLHRDVIGVTYRLKKDMEEVAGGNFSLRISLRKADSFKDTASELDRVVTNMRGRFLKADGIFREIKSLIDSIGEVKEEFLPEKCTRLVDNVRELQESMKK
jgi:methyl-accepting chemotaxis protein